MRTHAELAAAFRALHARPGAFVIPNPWDVGSARVLAGLGFEALATTSSGMAYALGKRDGAATRDEVLEHLRALVANVDIPINADLGNAFGDDPAAVGETFQLVAPLGVAGASVEDATGDKSNPIYEFDLAVERVRAAVDAVRATGLPVMVTARAEGFLHGKPDLPEIIKRLQAFQEAGADVLYAPGIKTRDEITAVCSSVVRPVNVLAALPGMNLTVADLAELGVKRISVGGLLAKVSIDALLRASEQMQQGSFAFADGIKGFADVRQWLSE